MDKVRIIIDGDEFWLEGGDFEDMLEVVRLVPGRRFDPQGKAWTMAGKPREVARALLPYRLMYLDDDPLGDSNPIQVLP